uniref:Uncharacterized protein n=1 Tax=Oryza brachyantha TaxID=4533 RepID=J3KU24_ORYBR
MSSHQQDATNNPMTRSCTKFAPNTLPANKLAPPSIFEMIEQHLEKISENHYQHHEKILVADCRPLAVKYH